MKWTALISSMLFGSVRLQMCDFSQEVCTDISSVFNNSSVLIDISSVFNNSSVLIDISSVINNTS